ncbi:MAG TPA: patatin-like phospholipase family protein [Candidatus Dormibacteraeota bacterium]|nr:patatin-like phospholipase family protein [Candidatus Dormibacteraeota bacterium]
MSDSPAKDPASSNVGISYSGGGPLLVVELGVAQAFVDLGIVPRAIAGVSAGSIAGVAHALDINRGTGIAAAIDAISNVTDATLKLRLPDIVWDVVWERQHLQGIGDNEPLKAHLQDAFAALQFSRDMTFKTFGQGTLPKLIVGATDRESGDPQWFGPDVTVADALIASSAIPAVFPAKRMTIDQKDRLFVDGGVVSNQPLWQLVEAGCTTIYSCAVGYDGGRLGAPVNLIDNAMESISILIHNATCLEEAFVRATHPEVVIHHIHPESSFPIQGFNFEKSLVQQVVKQSCQLTKDWIASENLMPGEVGKSPCSSLGSLVPAGSVTA